MRNAPSKQSRTGARAALTGWALAGCGLLAGVIGFTAASPLYGYAYEVRDMPVFWLAGGMAAAGAVFLVLPWLIRASRVLKPGLATGLLWAMLGAGLAMRLVLFASEPALEDDFQRYLWDGAVTASGLNPYETSPEAAMAADPEVKALGRLGRESGLTLGRINHPQLRTLYPPVAQGAFALAYWLEPWSLNAWRALILLSDLAAIALLLLLLRDLGRSPLWATLYWWNPVALKELYNSAHMDALVVPLMLGALVLAIRHRPLSATTALTLAAGIKIWPVILLPLIWRAILNQPKKLLPAIALALFGGVLLAWPIVSAGLDPSSGLTAYASKWKTNSAMFLMLDGLAGQALDILRIEALSSGLLARLAIVLAMGALVVWQCRTAAGDAQAIVRKALIITGAMFLLSPAQFPWYYLWVLPLLALVPVRGLLVLTATLPLYYTAFYFLSNQTYEVYSERLIWLIWLPAWGLLAWEARHWAASLLISLLPSRKARETS